MTDSFVCSGAQMQCSLGSNISVLQVLPDRTINLCATPMANIGDHRSENIPSFGACLSTAIPTPCLPVIPFPWERGKDDFLLRNQPALLKSSMCHCMRGGTIRLVTDGQEREGTQWVQKQNIQTFSKEEKKYVLVLKDAYWEKEDMKIRFIPHQLKIEELKVIFALKEDPNGQVKEKLSFKLKFSVPYTIFPHNMVINVLFSKLTPLGQAEDNNPLYIYAIKNFSSDLTEVKDLENE